MRTGIFAILLLTITLTGIVFYPFGFSLNVQANTTDVSNLQHVDPRRAKNRVEAVFVLDTTGSMSGMINAAKEKIWSIATSMASAEGAAEVKIGLVAYRDRGDDYVTRVLDLSNDLDTMYAHLMDFKAAGGGDGPESVNKALNDAVDNMSWSQDRRVYKVVFLVGDAPSHMDYKDEIQYPEIIKKAHTRGIVFNTIQSGKNSVAKAQWQRIANLGQGNYFQVGQSGNTVAIKTPFDRKMAALSKKLDDTRIYYGTEVERKRQQKKVRAAEKLHVTASTASQARRAEFNIHKSGKANRLGKNELVDDISSGRIKLSDIDKDKLPAEMRPMPVVQQRKLIEKQSKLRDDLIIEIKELSTMRKNYIKKKIKGTELEADSLDKKVYKSIREQAGKKGLKYASEPAAY